MAVPAQVGAAVLAKSLNIFESLRQYFVAVRFLQTPDTQMSTTILTNHAPFATQNITVPQLITKKWLCIRFGFFRNGRCNYTSLYCKVLTPSVIEKLGMQPDEVRRKGLKGFDRERTILLIQILDLK